MTTTGIPLHEAVVEGQLVEVCALLDAGADVNECNVYTQTSALHIAAGRGDADVTRVLLAAGADVEAAHVNGETPLFDAAWSRSVEVARLLLDAGANVMAMRAHLVSALHLTAMNDEDEGTPMLCYLLSRLREGTKLDELVTDTGCTPLHFACLRTSRLHASGYKALLARGATSDGALNNDGESAKAVARLNNKLHVVADFERHKARPFTIDDVPEAFIPMLTGDPQWRIDQMVAYWATRKWGCGTVPSCARSGSQGREVVDAGAGTSDSDALSAGVADGSGGGGTTTELAPQAHNVGLPQKIVFWQSMPRNVVALVAGLTCKLQ